MKIMLFKDHCSRQGQVRREVDPLPCGNRQTIQKSEQREPQIPERTVDISVGQIEAPQMSVPEDQTERVVSHPRCRRRWRRRRCWGWRQRRQRGGHWRRRQLRHLRRVLRLRRRTSWKEAFSSSNTDGSEKDWSNDQEENFGHGVEEGVEEEDETFQATI